MPVPQLDESTKAERLPGRALEFFVDTNVYVRSGGDLEAVYAHLKLALRLLAVRNPDAQSHALRSAFGMLIEGICLHKDSGKVRLDLLGLLVRMVDQKQGYKYNAMKHLAISGLGHLVKHVSNENRQVAVNVFIVCIESWRVAPQTAETLKYRQTILWTLAQAATETVTIEQAKYAARAARSVIEQAADPESVRRAFDLLTALVLTKSGQHYFLKRMETAHGLFYKSGSASADAAVRLAASRFYCAALLNLNPQGFAATFEAVCSAYTRLAPSTSRIHRADGHLMLMEELLRSFDGDAATALEEWLASALVQLDPRAARRVFGFVFGRLTDAAKVAAITTLLKVVAQAQPSRASSALESVLACLHVAIESAGSALEPVVEPVHLAILGLLINMTDESAKGNNAAAAQGSFSLSVPAQATITSCLITLVRTAPKLLLPTVELALKQFEAPDAKRVALAYVLGAMLAESRTLNLYSDMQTVLQIVDLAANLVKQREDFAKYNVAWILFCGVFRLGPDAVKPITPQMLVLWEAHLSPAACAAPACVERALTGLLAFVVHNRALLTRDVAFRVGRLLTTVWDSIESMPPDPLVRGRLLQCFDRVLDVERDLCPASLLMKYVAHVTSTGTYDKDTGVAIPSAILAPSRSQLKESRFRRKPKTGELAENVAPESAVEAGLAFHLGGELVNDVDFILLQSAGDSLPDDKYTRVVNAALSVTAKMLPRQPARIQESVLSSIFSELRTAFGTRTARRTAVIRNIALFIEQTFEHGLRLDERTVLVGLGIVKQLLASENYKVRLAGARACEQLFLHADNSAGAKQLMPHIKELVDTIGSATYAGDRAQPELIAGSILCLGYLSRVYPYRSVLEAIERVVLPLHGHPSFDVSIACLTCFQQMLQTPSFLDARMVRRALKLVTNSYLQELHSSVPAYQREIALLLAQCVSRLGPALAEDENHENRHLIFSLASVLQRSTSVEVHVTGSHVLIELYYFARHNLDWSVCFHYWSNLLRNPESTDEELDSASAGLALRQSISDADRDGIFLVLDRNPKSAGLRKLLRLALDTQCNLVGGDASSTNQSMVNTLKWVQLVNTVVTKPRAVMQPVKRRHEHTQSQDEDSALGVVADDHNEQFCWEVRSFALQLLLRLLRSLGGSVQLKTRIVGDIVKLAFSAITSPVAMLQQHGLELMNVVVVQFGDLSDPDFPQISLLEQYQVQLVSALCSAFNADSTPFTALAALHTCGMLLGSPIFKAKEKFAKLLKVLAESVDSISDDVESTKFALGDLAMTANASRVLKIGVLGVWAVLRVEKPDETGEDLDARRAKLVELWEQYILEFARLSHSYSDMSPVSFKESVDQMRTTLLCNLMRPVFEKSWMLFVKALAIEEEKVKDEQFAFMLYGFSVQALMHYKDQSHQIVLETLERLLTLHAVLVEYIDELLPVLYRSMLFTQQPSDQLVVLKIVQLLAAGLDQSDENVDIMFEMVKITVLPLRSYFPQLFDHAPTQEAPNTEDALVKTKIVRSALDTMMDIVQRFPEIVQDDLWICLIRIFEKVNETEPALAAPSFKRLLEMLNMYIDAHSSAPVLNALLMSFQRAVSDSSTNSLLICTAVICTSTNFFTTPAALQLVESYGGSLARAIAEDAVVNTPFLITAIKSCVNTPEIVLAVMRACLPALVRVALQGETRAALRATDALTVYVALDPQPKMMALVLPLIVAVASQGTDTAQREPRSRQQLMQLVTKDAAAFKQAVQHMDAADTDRLQELMRLEVPDDESSSDEETDGITLTSFE